MKKRTEHYILNPAKFDMRCDICNGINLEWSEYDGLIWCYDCEKDTKGIAGIFDGPIPVNVSHMLGIHFDKWDMVKKHVVKFNYKDSCWDKPDVQAKHLLENSDYYKEMYD